MKKITTVAIASSLVLASTAAFAGGMVEPTVESVPVVVTEGGSSSGTPLWAVIGGVVLVGALISSSDSSN